MANVVLAMSISLDGFIAGPHARPDEALGEGGQILHEWIFHPSGREFLAQAVKRTGAVVMGRQTYEVSQGPHAWGDAGSREYVPCFVLTHRPPPQAHPAFTFVTDGIHSAIAAARVAAGGRDVGVMGAQTGRQCLRAGLVDEIVLSLVPVLLGAGTRLFHDEAAGRQPLHTIAVTEGTGVTHLELRFPQKEEDQWVQ